MTSSVIEMGDGNSLAIDVQGLRKTYPGRPPVAAVRGIDLQVPRGQCYGVLGPNGAGKTTTIEILEGLMPPSAGAVKVLGLTWQNQAQQIREQIGVSLQETQLSEKLSVRETLQLFGSFYHKALPVDEAIERVALQEKRDTWVKKLSGGQKQRLAIACAIVGDPALLFLDEPTSGLDPTNRRQLWEIIHDFRQSGRTILLTTHYMEEAERLCDRVAIIDQGRIIAEGSPSELIASLQAEHVIEVQIDRVAAELAADQLLELHDVKEAELAGHRVRLSVGQPHVVLPQLIETLGRLGILLTGLTTRHVTLEDVFLQLTGRHLSEENDPTVSNGDDSNLTKPTDGLAPVTGTSRNPGTSRSSCTSRSKP